MFFTSLQNNAGKVRKHKHQGQGRFPWQPSAWDSAPNRGGRVRRRGLLGELSQRAQSIAPAVVGQMGQAR